MDRPLIRAPLRWAATFNVAVATFAIFAAAAASVSTFAVFGWGFAWVGWFCLAVMAWLGWADERTRHGTTR